MSARESDEPHTSNGRGGSSEGTEALDRDEKVKLDLSFGTALRALLKTSAPKSEPAEKLPAPRKP
jgi:hypothetical protein